MLVLLLAASLGALLVTHGDCARPHVLVYKRVVSSSTGGALVSGRPFSVVYTVTNVGAEEALRVKVKDSWPADLFEELGGKATASWTRLEAGDNHTFSIELRARSNFVFYPPRATVDYQYIRESGESTGSDSGTGDDEGDGDEEEDELVDVAGFSSKPGEMAFVSEDEYSERTASAVLPATVAAAGAFFIVVYHYNGLLHARGGTA